MASFESERPLNSLETIFASCNVRFALLVVLEDHENEQTNSLLEALQKHTAEAVETSILGHLALQKNEQDEWSLLATDKAVAPVKIRNIAMGEDYGAFLHELVHQETIPSEGPLWVQILKDDSAASRSSFLGLLVNGNHAMVDGRSLTRLVSLATNNTTDSASDAVTNQEYRSPPKLKDWKDLVEQPAVTAWKDDPPFLLPKHDILTLQELCQEPASKGSGHYFGLELSGDTIRHLKALLKQNTEGGATMSGFLSGIILLSLAQEYHNSDPKALAISMLVDLRPYVDVIGQQNDMGEIPQLHGCVNLVESTDRLAVMTGDNAVDITEKHCIWDLSLTLTRQLKSRVERGEAHRNALALTSGKFDQSGPAATLELSNLGVCQLPRNAKLFTSQRFDGYDGVSCMIHSESSTGCMQWNVSVGEGLDVDMIQRVFQRAHGWCLDLTTGQPCMQ